MTNAPLAVVLFNLGPYALFVLQKSHLTSAVEEVED